MTDDEMENLIAMRRRVLGATGRERADLRALFADGADGFIAWCRACAWTFVIKQVDGRGMEVPAKVPHCPFVLWPCQEVGAREIVRCVMVGEDVVVGKSRDMGASWLLMGVSFWGWLFHGWHSLLVSRVQDLVDKSGDPDSLFWKVDYLLSSQPVWLLPGSPKEFLKGGSNRQHLMLKNPKSGATITGQASTEHVGRGGRRTLVVFDEFAALDNAAEAWRSATDVTSCRVAVSTPIGAGTEYSRLKALARSTGRPKLVELMYFGHPQKSAGGEERVDVDGSVTNQAGSKYLWSPWLAEQIKKRDRIDLAQNVFAQDIGSGAAFFSSYVLAQHREKHELAERRCEISRGRLVGNAVGRWRIIDEPSPRDDYCMFIDPSYGTGSANSAVVVCSSLHRRVVGYFADPNISTHDLALEVANACRRVWRGLRPPLVGWEINGPGMNLQGDFERARYRPIYRSRRLGVVNDSRTERVGWMSTKASKRVLLGNLSRALAQGEFEVPSGRILDELGGFLVLDDGRIESVSRRDLDSGAAEAHGDLAIATAGCLLLCEEGAAQPSDYSTYERGTLGDLLGFDKVVGADPWRV